MKCEKCSKPISSHSDFMQAVRDKHILKMLACWDCVHSYLKNLAKRK